ncbi:RsmB/NOP family class I SAM-dependent RNA methyltransferase [Slackia exigua]|nr:RsmB/NOP family class I SAM-dependent RNA methyltransferase [Slackia exigua]
MRLSPGSALLHNDADRRIFSKEHARMETPSFPAYFRERVEEAYGADSARLILEGCSTPRRSSLRANALKASRNDVACALDAADISWKGVPWYEDAFLLDAGADEAVRETDAFERGEVYLQNLSSMLPALLLDARPDTDILDMCAAPGGKTTQIAALAAAKARVGVADVRITACEMHAPRAEKLAYNLKRQGARAVTVMRIDARRIDAFFRFDHILLDAPCTGSGTMRAHDPKAAARFTPHLLKKCSAAQRALLDRALTVLKPGGTMVYSTCSILPEENERAVREVLGRKEHADRFELLSPALPTFDSDRLRAELPLLPCTMEEALCVRPTDAYEGFFMVKIRRVR